MIIIILLLAFLQSTYSSSCGDTLIPFSFEVLPNGQPILGCAKPSCFGWSPDGQPLGINASFSRIHQHADGFMRSDPTSIPSFDLNDPRVYANQQATCEEAFPSLSCASEDQWVGGIVPLLNVTQSMTAVQCCTYNPLRIATDQGIATVELGQVVIGGEVYENGQQYAFDYISNVEKIVDEDQKIKYEVNIRRLPCLSLQSIDKTNKKVNEAEEVIRGFNKFAAAKAMAHQAQTVEADQNAEKPLRGAEAEETAVAVGLDDPETATSVIVKENIAQPGLIQPQQIPFPPTGTQSQVGPLSQPVGLRNNNMINV